jgi:hypothetical protein
MHLGYNLDDIPLMNKELLCNSYPLSLWNLCSTPIFGVHCVYIGLSFYSKYLVHNVSSKHFSTEQYMHILKKNIK